MARPAMEQPKRRILGRIRDESGVALIVALGLLFVLSAAGTGVYVFATSNQTATYRARSQFSALEVAKAGVDQAVSVLAAGDVLNVYTLHPQDPDAPSPNECVDPPLNTGQVEIGDACSPFTFTTSEGTATVWGWLSASDLWTIHSTGTVNAVGGGHDERSVTATVQITPGSGSFNTTTWNYAISAGTSDATTCDMTIDQTVTVTMPVYVEGNLCLANTASIQKGTKPVRVSVGGQLALFNSSFAGTSAAPIDEVHVAGGCTAALGTAGHVCTSADRVYATTSDETLPAIPIPDADYATEYADASPGPMHPCTTTSGSPPSFDNDGSIDLTTYPNGSLPSTVDLTPSKSYTCETSSGKLDWNASTQVLTVSGLVYFDGSVSMSKKATATYSQDKGTIYMSGSFAISNQAKLCANSSCDFSSWSPDSQMLLIVVHGSDGVSFGQQTEFQGGVFSDHALDMGEGSALDGPMIGHPIYVGQGVTINPLPPLSSPPEYAPTPPNTHAAIGRPVYTSGG